MASALPAPETKPVKPFLENCANCMLFTWKQPESQHQQPLQMCTRCRVPNYCGKECQEEHWNKVHKNHCKYLAGIKTATHSEHKKDTCPTCIAGNLVGDLVFSPTNPNYVCIFKNINLKTLYGHGYNWGPTYPNPFPLTGLPQDRIENMINVGLKILLKIKVTQNQIYLTKENAVDQLEIELWKLKGAIHTYRIMGIIKDPLWILKRFMAIFKSPERPWIRLGCSLDQRQQEGYKLWTTFALVIEIMFSTLNICQEKSLKSPDLLPEEYRHMSKKDQFFEVADKIIEALDHQVVPFDDLAAIACGGKTEQSCSQCHKKVDVNGIFLRLPMFQERTASAEIVFNPVENERYICKSTVCYNKEKQRNELDSWVTAVNATVVKLKNARCDHCFLLASPKEVHRSRCLTKNYCSQFCRDADDAAHKVCCNPDKEHQKIEKRKQKLGYQEKIEAANAQLDRISKAVSKCDLNQASAENVEKIIDKTRKTKSFAKKKKKTKVDEVD